MTSEIKNIPKDIVRRQSYRNYVFYSNGQFLFEYTPDYPSGLWGSYYVTGDTIKAQFIEAPHHMSWDKGEIWFKIIDKSTLQHIGFTWREPMSSDDMQRYKLENADTQDILGHFVQNDSLPDPDNSWIKKREWFWCDMSKFKKWKQDLSKNSK